MLTLLMIFVYIAFFLILLSAVVLFVGLAFMVAGIAVGIWEKIRHG